VTARSGGVRIAVLGLGEAASEIARDLAAAAEQLVDLGVAPRVTVATRDLLAGLRDRGDLT
jgi:hypothetical protein